MIQRRVAIKGGVALGALGAFKGQAQTPGSAAAPPAQAFFGKPVLGKAKISPDGSNVAMRITAQDSGRTRLAMLDLSTMQSKGIAALAESDIDDFVWVNEQRLVFDTAWELVDYRRADFGPGLYAVDAEGRAIRELVSSQGEPADGVERKLLHWSHSLLPLPWLPEGDQVLVYRPEEISKDKVGHYSVKWLNVRNGLTREVDTPVLSEHWTFDTRGQLRAAVVREGAAQSLRWRLDDGSWKTLRQFDLHDGDGWWPGFVDANARLYVTAGHQGRSALFAVDASTGQIGAKPIAAHPQFDIHPEYIVRQGQLIGLRYTIDAEVTQWLDSQAQALQAAVDKLLPGTVNRLNLPQRGNSPWVLVESFSDQQPYRAWVYNTGTHKLTRLGDSRPAIDARRMGTTDLQWIKARDGRSLPVWVTLPPGGVKQNLPMVVWVHGGPWVRGMSWRWHDEVQFLASRGYAVIQPEFRGSTGYGYEHFRAGWKQWGQSMQTDLADAARWAIAQKIADPQRIGILGASYGGYATLMGLAREPQLFKAGVAWAAVSDLQMLYSLRWSDFTRETKTLGLPRLLGDPQADAAMLSAHSPVKLAERIQQPLLLAHGAWDARVPMDHGEAMRDALKPHNRQVEWLVYKNEGHGWQRPENLVDFWQRVERFLGQHLAAPRS